MKDNYIFFDATLYTSSLRCTIQRSGKIGFSDFTQRKLGINDTMSIRIGIDGDKKEYSHLLIQLLSTVEQNAFKINKAGIYFYCNPKPLLDELEIDYKKKNIMYDMIPVDEDEKIYKLIKKEGKVLLEK